VRYLKDARTGKRISRQKAPDALIVHDMPDLRIVPAGSVGCGQAATGHAVAAGPAGKAPPSPILLELRCHGGPKGWTIAPAYLEISEFRLISQFEYRTAPVRE
jgi:hypothetical protein